MRISSNRSNVLVSAASAGLVLLAGYCGPALAAPLSLVNTPLYLTPPATPNLIMAIDDSGSMDYETTLATNDGAAWWRSGDSDGCTSTDNKSFTGCVSVNQADTPGAGKLNFNSDGGNATAWDKYVSLFPNGCTTNTNNDLRRTCGYTYYAIPPVPAYAWTKANAYNNGFFDPSVAYDPWTNGGAYTFVNATPTAARFDPVLPSSGALTINLTQDVASAANVSTSTACTSLTANYNSEWAFHLRDGMALPAGTCYRRSSGGWASLATALIVTGSSTPRDGDDVNIRYYPATFYLTATEAAALPATYGYIGSTLSGTAPDGTTLTGYQIKSANFSTAAQYDAALQNFANWFTYYRKRHLALRAGLGKSFNPVGGLRVAGFRINDNTANVTMLNIDTPADRTTLYNNMYANWTGRAGTPNRDAVANIVRNFKRSGAVTPTPPIQYACQQNFGMLFTDGFSDAPGAGDGINGVAGNADSGKGTPYADSITDTLADAVMNAYTGPLIAAPTFPTGKVHPPLACSAASPDPRLDCNANLHMNFFAITLGTRGITYNPDSPVDPYVTAPTWPPLITTDRNPLSVDDLWHATVNGRGQLFNVDKPTDLSTKLSNVLNSISDLTHSSASSAAVNSGSISSDTRVYQARFDTATWEGQLLAHTINTTTGALGALDWDAGTLIPTAGSRQIVTVNTSATPVAFQWASLDSGRQNQLDASATIGTAKLNYVRGDAANEAPSGYAYRKRPTTKLGDIVNSSPVYVGKPSFGYPDSLESAPYSTFVSSKATRQPMVYAGANDGMMHGFNGTTGVEAFGFIPSRVFPNLSLLTSPTYSHRYFVDGTAQSGDAFFGSAWHTMLVGGLNAGGQEIYALEITNPSNFATVESSPSTLVKWEFTDTNDADLGYTFSQPQIVRMHNGKWAAVFGNGYNNTTADGLVSSTGKAALYIVDIENGSLIRKISLIGSASTTGDTTTPNGLATPALVDIDGDRIVDFAFAGDLFGNMWKFDLRSSTPASWNVPFSSGGNPLPLYVAKDNAGTPNRQPITERPVVIRGPSGAGMTVLFGTGKYLESADNTSTAVQTFYGIYDRNSSPIVDTDRVTTRAALQLQSITNELSVDFDGAGPGLATNLRVTSNSTVDPTTQRGWYMDLTSPVSGAQGEKSVSNPIVRNGHLIFTTLIPSSDPCSDGGTSWLMEIDALSGKRLSESAFDLNGDGIFSEADYVTLPDGTRVPASGLKSTEGILPTPGVLANKDKEFKYTPGTSGEIQVTVENPGKSGTGRQSWRQVR